MREVLAGFIPGSGEGEERRREIRTFEEEANGAIALASNGLDGEGLDEEGTEALGKVVAGMSVEETDEESVAGWQMSTKVVAKEEIRSGRMLILREKGRSRPAWKS